MSVRRGEYERLTKPRRSGFAVAVVSYYNLWLGAEHLLQLENKRYTESYKRFPYKAIASIVVTRNRQRMIHNIVLSVFFAIFGLPTLAGLVMDWHWGVNLALASASLIFLACVLINSLLGQTCTVFIHTSVQSTRLFSVNRLRIARRVLDAVRLRVEDAQGGLALAEEAPETNPANARIQRIKRENEPPLIRPYRGQALLVLLAFLIADLCHSVAHFFIHNKTFATIGVLLFLAILLAMITALIRQHRTDLPKRLRVITWSTLGYLFFMNLYGQLCSTLVAVTNPELINDSGQILGYMAKVSPLDSVPVLIGTILSIAISGSLGFLGLAFYNSYLKSRNLLPPVTVSNETAT